MSQITVFIVIEHLRIGGAELAAVQLARELDRSIVHPTIVTFLDGALDESVRQDDIEIVGIRSRSKAGRFRALVKLLRRRRPDVVHTHMFSAGFWARLAGCFLPTTAFVHTHHSLTFQNKVWKRYLPERLLTLSTDRVICVSDAVAAHLAEAWRLPRRKLLVIPNGVPIRSDVGRRDAFHLPPKLVAVGRLVPVKGFDLLLSALAILQSSGVDVRCAIVGNGGERQQLAKLCRELSLDGKVAFTGLRRDVASILDDGDIYVVSSRREGLSLALLEAMASGLPIVATRVGGNTELLDGAGCLVPSEDPQALADAIRDLIARPDVALELGRRARDRIAKHYSIEATVRSHERLYVELTERRRNGRRKTRAAVALSWPGRLTQRR